MFHPSLPLHPRIRALGKLEGDRIPSWFMKLLQLQRLPQMRAGGMLEQHRHLRYVRVLLDFLVMLPKQLTALPSLPAEDRSGNDESKGDQGDCKRGEASFSLR